MVKRTALALPALTASGALALLASTIEASHTTVTAETLDIDGTGVVYVKRRAGAGRQNLEYIWIVTYVIAEERRFALCADWTDRPVMVAKDLGLAALLQAVRDIVDGRVNELVDGQTRTRLEHWFDGVSTPDKQDTTWGLRRLRYLSTGQHVKHVSIVSLVNGAEVCVEQVAGSGDDHAPTQLWRVGLITPDGMGDAWCFGRPSAIEVDSAHDAVCVLMQLNVEAEEATLA